MRKTVGAKTRQIFSLLLRSFSKPVLIGSLAAWPLAYIAASEYANLFGNTLALGPLPFVASLLLIAAVAGAAVGRQA